PAVRHHPPPPHRTRQGAGRVNAWTLTREILTSGQASVTAPDLSWRDLGACQGMPADLFSPERGDSTEEAKEVCRGCVVRAQCLEYALENSERFGIWGGTSERQRRRMRRARRTGERRHRPGPRQQPRPRRGA